MPTQVKWLQCYMYNLTHIKYSSYELYPEYYSLSFDKFLAYLDSLCNLPIETKKFISDLQSFIPLIVNLETRQWERLDVSSDKVNEYDLWVINIKDKNIFNPKEVKTNVMDGNSYFTRNSDSKKRDEAYNNFFGKLRDTFKKKKL